MARHYFLEVSQVAVLCNQDECALAINSPEEGVEIVHNEGASKFPELASLVHGFLEPILILVYLGN